MSNKNRNKNRNVNVSETESVRRKENSSGLPFLIIGAAAILSILGGIWYFRSAAPQPTPTKTNTNAAANNNSNTSKPGTQSDPGTAPTVSNVPGALPLNFRGGQNAPVVIEEFSDYQCPTCAAVHPLFNEILSSYGNRVKFIYRNYPLTQIHPNSYDASLATEAAGLQGKYWEMQNMIFQNQQRWSSAAGARALFESYAQTLGLDVAKFKEDMSGMIAKQRVDADVARGRSLNINGTPTIFINNRQVPVDKITGADMKTFIESELAKASVETQSQKIRGNQQPAVNGTANTAVKPNANASK